MTKIVCVIPVRINSTRLPAKHFMEINASRIIDTQYKNVNNCVKGVEVIYAIPDTKENDLLATYLESNNINFYRGSEHNVYQRIVDIASKEKADWLIRINGDNVFHVQDLFEQVVDEINNDKYDLVTNVYPRSYPAGCSIEAIRASVFIAEHENSNLTDEDKEHVMPFFYRTLDDSKIKNILLIPACDGESLALDTRADYEAISFIAKSSGTVINSNSIAELVNIRKQFKQSYPFIGKHGVFTIAEVGGNHEGDFEYAKKLVQLACETDVDCVKLQIYSPDLLVNKNISPQRHAHFGKFTLAKQQYMDLIKMIRDAGKTVSASVWSIKELHEYIEYIDFIKVGSGDLTDALMLNAAKETGKPVIVSTGLASLEDVRNAIKLIDPDKSRGEKIGILQCTSMYPIPDFDCNLNVMSTFKEAFPLNLIGYSDHTVGYDALIYSVASGAKILEFHFTDNKEDRSFRDHLVSLTKSDVGKLIKAIINVNTLMGTGVKKPVLSEDVNGHVQSFRKGVFLIKDMKKGDVISVHDLITLRPDEGIAASESFDLLGKVLNQDIDANQTLSWDMFK